MNFPSQVFFNDIILSLILCNVICDQCLFIVHCYVASKVETKEKNGRESNDEIKE